MRISLKKEYSTHLPVLMKVVSLTDGDVLELGSGFYSTPFLHWACFPTKRQLVTYDSLNYSDLMKRYQDDSFHKTIITDNYEKIDIEKSWDVAFVDHAPGIRRGIEAGRLAKYTKYVVLHDSNPHNDSEYGYNKIYPLYKYRFDYTEVTPNTTVLSNFVDLTNFKI